MAIKDYKCLNYLTKWWILNNLNVFEMCVAFHNPYMGRWIKHISISLPSNPLLDSGAGGSHTHFIIPIWAGGSHTSLCICIGKL